jgi:hypothetical protein
MPHQELDMTSLSRRGAIKLASSLLATAPILMRGGCAKAAAEPGLVVLDMASFGGAGIDADTAFAKAIATIEKAAADARKGGEPVRIVLNLEKGATYRIKRPLAFKQLSGFELNGNGAELINTTRSQTLQISASNRVTIRDLTIDYDPLPFTEGTIASFDKAALQITVKVDPFYPDDAPFLASITDGFFKVMDRATRALKVGARDPLTPAKVEKISEGLIKVHLRWGANECFPS